MLKFAFPLVLTMAVWLGLAGTGLAQEEPVINQDEEWVEVYEASTLSGLFLAATLAETERDIPSAADFYRQAYELDPTSDRFLQSAFTMELADGRMLGALDLAAVLAASGDTGMSRLVLALDAMRQRSYRVAVRELQTYQTDGFGDLGGLARTNGELWQDARNGRVIRFAAIWGAPDFDHQESAKLSRQGFGDPFHQFGKGGVKLRIGRRDQIARFAFDQSLRSSIFVVVWLAVDAQKRNLAVDVQSPPSRKRATHPFVA